MMPQMTRCMAFLLVSWWALPGCDDPGPTLQVADFRLSDAPPGALTRAGYLTLHNRGKRERVLTSATSNAYQRIEFHRTEVVDDVSTMRREARVHIAPGASVTFEPFGRHLMLMQPLDNTRDDLVTITLCFGDGECVELTPRDAGSR